MAAQVRAALPVFCGIWGWTRTMARSLRSQEGSPLPPPPFSEEAGSDDDGDERAGDDDGDERAGDDDDDEEVVKTAGWMRRGGGATTTPMLLARRGRPRAGICRKDPTAETREDRTSSLKPRSIGRKRNARSRTWKGRRPFPALNY